MCYMNEQSDRRTRVGVRELRQNLSVYLRRVKAGETLEVTEHGRLVASLGPPRDEALSPYERLRDEARIKPASVPWEDVRLPLPADPGPSLSEVLRGMRDEDER